AAALVDLLGLVRVDRPPDPRPDLARQALAVDPDQRAQAVPVHRDVELLERAGPGVDPLLDGVDERAVEVEQDGLRSREVVGIGHGPTIPAGQWLSRDLTIWHDP